MGKTMQRKMLQLKLVLYQDTWICEESLLPTQEYHKFSNRGAIPYRGAPLLFGPKTTGFLDVFAHISAKNGPIFNL